MRSTIFLIITILTIPPGLACSRELTSGDATPQQPFPFDRIPALGSPDAPEQLSAGETESIVESEGPTEVVEQPEEDPMIEGLLQSGRDALRQDNLPLAIEYFIEVIERDENNVAALYNCGRAYRLMGDNQKAIEYSRRAVEADTGRLYVHQNLGYAYEAAGDIDNAITEFEQELINHPDEPHLAGIADKLAQYYLQRGLHQEAFDAARRAVTLDPDQPSYHANLAAVHMSNGAYEQAVDSLEEAVVLAPDSALYRKLLGDALWGAGREDDARQEYASALTLDPDMADEIDPDRLPGNINSAPSADPSL